MKAKVLLALSIASAASHADETEIERVLVTSEFRPIEVLKVPSSISIFDQAALTQRQVQHLDELLNAAPNLNFTRGASRGRFIQIRGIGERSQFAEPINPSVGFVIDDLDFSGTVGIGTPFDVEQVEVLRGPQGTTFGATAMAGVVRLKSKDPTAEREGFISASIAQQDSWNLAGGYGGALNEQWLYRVAAQQYKSDGFVDNDFLGRDDTNGIDEFGSRVKLRYLASEEVVWDFGYHYFDVDNGYDAFSLDNNNRTLSDEPGFDRQETHGFSTKLTWDFDRYTFEGVAGLSQSELGYGYDEDWTFIDFHPFAYSSTDEFFRDRDTNSLDLRWLSNDSGRLFGGTTDWVVGAYLKQIDEDLLRQYTFIDNDFTSDFEVDTQAVYGELVSALTSKTQFTIGVRVEDTTLDYTDSSGFTASESETLFGGRVVLDHQWRDDTLFYASMSRGYKLGGFNPDQRVAQAQRFFEAEYNWNYELGVKGRYFQDRLTLRLAAFYMDRRNTQVNDFTTEAIAGDSGATSFIDIIDNANLGENLGLELETLYRATDTVELFANIGLLDATIEDYTNARGDVVDEQEQAQAPSYTFNIGTRIALGQDWFWTVEADGKDEFRFSDGHDVMSPSFVLVNTRLTYNWSDYRLALWGKNLFDRVYFVRGFGGFSNDPRDAYAFPEPYLQQGDGRQLGVTLDYQF